MSAKSNDQGRAFEYVFILNLQVEISKVRKVNIVENSSLKSSMRAYYTINQTLKDIYDCSSKSAIEAILDLEPLIFEPDNDLIELTIQPDVKGTEGDIRDILITRKSLQWEIGLSIKHNHFAVKHSRLSSKLDFGKSWYKVSCSVNYWNEVNPIFEFLKTEKIKQKKWSDLSNKVNIIYKPLLIAFINEVRQAYIEDSEVPKRMVEYLLGEFDFYKIISLDSSKTTLIQAFNLHGMLNKNGNSIPKIIVPVSELPTRIISFDFKTNSENTVELYLDNGWQFSFRIHNASTIVEPSLKFDIQIIGMPISIMTILCKWK